MEGLERELAGHTTARHPLTRWEDVSGMEQGRTPATTGEQRCDKQYGDADVGERSRAFPRMNGR
jgi:hypothetical protein